MLSTEHPIKQRLKRSASVKLIDLVSPDYSWPYPYSIEQAFQTFRWMVASGSRYADPEEPTVIDLLSDTSGQGHVTVRPVGNLEDLRRRFHLALFSKLHGAAVSRWRLECGIRVDQAITLPYRHYKPLNALTHLGFKCEADIRQKLVALLQVKSGTKLTESLNSIHKRARTIHRVDLSVHAKGFAFQVHYGFNAFGPRQMDSEWSHNLAHTVGDEPFLDTFARAANEFERLTAGPPFRSPNKTITGSVQGGQGHFPSMTAIEETLAADDDARMAL